MLVALIRLARIPDWIKNVFVLVPVPFAVATETAGAQFAVVPFLLGLLGFCLINSSVYTFNDVCDARADRLHPRKCKRPVASGLVSVRIAAGQALVLLLAGIGLVLSGGGFQALQVVLIYVGVNLAYNLGAKQLAVLDVFLLASGYVIRVILGCILINVSASAWLLLCTSALALFLGFTKRRADLLAGLEGEHRRSLEDYSKAFLDQAMAISGGVALLSYALYSLDSAVFVPGRELASLPFVAYGILNYLRLAGVEGKGDSPVEIAYTSRSSQICALGWLATVLWSLGK